MRTLLLITFAILTRAVLQPASSITRLLTKTLTMARANIDLLRRAVSNDARNSNANSRNAPDPRNTEDDRKLKTLLPTFCKYHHSHAGCPPTLRGNANYKRLLQEGLKRMPAAIWLKGELEEIYPRWFDGYCAGRAVLPRQKHLMIEFFEAWTRGVHEFVENEASRRMVNGVH